MKTITKHANSVLPGDLVVGFAVIAICISTVLDKQRPENYLLAFLYNTGKIETRSIHHSSTCDVIA